MYVPFLILNIPNDILVVVMQQCTNPYIGVFQGYWSYLIVYVPFLILEISNDILVLQQCTTYS